MALDEIGIGRCKLTCQWR